MPAVTGMRALLLVTATGFSCLLGNAPRAHAIEMFTYFGDGSRIGLPSLEVPIEAYPGIPLRSDRIRARRAGQPVPQGTIGRFRGRGITLRIPAPPPPAAADATSSVAAKASASGASKASNRAGDAASDPIGDLRTADPVPDESLDLSGFRGFDTEAPQPQPGA
jgi:hypothetical protein